MCIFTNAMSGNHNAKLILNHLIRKRNNNTKLDLEKWDKYRYFLFMGHSAIFIFL